MSETRQSHSVEIAAGVDRCIAVLLDFERYPEWSGPITEARVLERDAEGRGCCVAFALDMKIRTVRYTLAYEFDLPRGATWSLVEGDVADVVGGYGFEPIGPNRTKATCSQEVDVGFWIPGPLRRIFEKQALRDSVEDFKRAVEGGSSG